MPAYLKLQLFAKLIYDAFEAVPYLVGSSSGQSKQWRDVDIRLMLSDEDFIKRYGHWNPGHAQFNIHKWQAECMAYSALGKELTGLPIDFQIQDTTRANESYSKGPREALCDCLRKVEEHDASTM